MQKKVAEEADDSAPNEHEEVNQKKPIDEQLMKNLSLLVGTRGEIIILLKCIVGVMHLE